MVKQLERMISAVLVVAAVPVLAPPAHGAVSDVRVAAMADRYLDARTRLGRFSGAVFIARGGKVIFRKGYGYADVDHRVLYTPETPQPIASLSKMFTAMAALRLRDAGRLQLADPICRHLDACPDAWWAVTVEQLIHHESGIPDYEERLDLGSDRYETFMSDSNATRRIYDAATRQALDFEPGSQFHYSNTGYIVLGHVIEHAAGRPFAEYLRETLLEPIRLGHTGSFGDEPAPSHLARGYTHASLDWGKTLAGVSLTDGHLKPVPTLPLTPPAGDTGMFSTVDDLYQWTVAMEGGSAIPAKDAAEATTPGLGHYGAGWIIDDFGGEPRLRHNGVLPGFLSELARFPKANVTLVVLSNLDTARLGRVIRDLSAMALGMPWDMPVEGRTVTLASEQIQSLEGKFRTPSGDTLTIVNDPPMLSATIPGRFIAGLIPMSPTEAYMPMAEGRAIFALGRDGKAIEVDLHYDGDDHRAERIGAKWPKLRSPHLPRSGV